MENLPKINLDKGLLSKIYNKVLKLNKTSNNLIIKWQKKKIKWQRFGHPTKEDIPMATCIWKDIQHHMSLEKCKLKQWDTARLLTEWPKSRALTTPNVDEGVEQQELSFIAGGNGTWFSHFGRQFGSFLWNWTYSYQYNPAISVLGIYPNELKIYVYTKACTWTPEQLYS